MLELEYRQCYIYFFLAFFFYYISGYFITLIVLSVLILAPLEELDPEEVEHEEELLPFIENTYIETDWFKGNLYIKNELYLEEQLLDTEIIVPFFKENYKKEVRDEEYKKLELIHTDLITVSFFVNDAVLLNDVRLSSVKKG